MHLIQSTSFYLKDMQFAAPVSPEIKKFGCQNWGQTGDCRNFINASSVMMPALQLVLGYSRLRKWLVVADIQGMIPCQIFQIDLCENHVPNQFQSAICCMHACMHMVVIASLVGSCSKPTKASLADVASLGDAWLAPAIGRGLIQPIPDAESYRWWVRTPFLATFRKSIVKTTGNPN